MKEPVDNIIQKLSSFFKNFDSASKNKAIDIMEFELGEMENIFALLVLGAFIGFPSPPMQITLDLLPDMEKHFLMMLNKVDTAESPLSDLLSAFDVI
jgi:hypothetical protein